MSDLQLDPRAMKVQNAVKYAGAVRAAEKSIREMKDQVVDANARIDNLIMMTNIMKEIIESHERLIGALTPR